MDSYQTIKISSNFAVELDSTPRKIVLSDDVKRQIDSFWEQERNQNPLLFNGNIMSATSYNKERVIGQFVEYKHFMAQIRQPELKKHLQINVLAISGVTQASNYVLIGKRGKQVAHYPGYYELTPSGGVDSDAFVGHYVDYQEQFQRELEEETGYKKQQIVAINPLYLVQEDSCLDIVANIQLSITDLNVKATHEYEELIWIARDRLRQFVDKHRHEVVPLTVFLISKLF